MAVARDQPDRGCLTAGAGPVQPAAAHGRAGGPDRDRGVAGSGLGDVRVAGDGHPAPAGVSCARCAGTRSTPGLGCSPSGPAIAQRGGRTWEKATKTHQQRRITLDEATLALLRAYLQRCGEQADALGFRLPVESRMFSPDPDGSSWLKPDSVTQPAVPADVRPARMGHAPPPTAALLGHRADHRRVRRADGRRPTRPRQRRDHHPPDLLRLAVGGRPTGRRRACRRHPPAPGHHRPGAAPSSSRQPR